MSIVENLDKLTPEELQKVGNLIEKFAKRKEIQQPEPKPNRKRKRKKKQKEVDNTSEKLIVEHGPGRKRRRRRVVRDEHDDIPTTRRKGRGRTEPKNPKNKKRTQQRGNRKRRRDRGSRGVMARTESVELTGENRFIKMRERNHKKGDVSSKKLWRGRTPTERPEKYEDVEVQCKECALWFDVNPGLVLIDADTKEPNFTCNNCSPRGN